jgi:hypothetical protein
MLMHDKTRPDHNRLNGTYTLTRNNLEFAAIVVYFFALAVLFAITLIVMLFQTGDGMNARAANDHQPEVMALASAASSAR